jgi:hypothetical protein
LGLGHLNKISHANIELLSVFWDFFCCYAKFSFYSLWTDFDVVQTRNTVFFNYGRCPNVNKINPEGVELFFEFFGRLLQAVVNFIVET